jgi:hypothetical protein
VASQPVFEGSTDPDVWLRLAKEWAAEGRLADALQAHRFYHRHSAGRAGHGGVRLSFALSDWARLAKVHPPAMRALRSTRDRATRSAVGPPFSWEFFHDALALNEALSDPEGMYELIGAIEAVHPDEVAGNLTRDVQHLLISRGEYMRCLRWMGDPIHKLEMAAVMLVSTGGVFRDGREARRSRDRYVEEIRELVLILVRAGRTRTATKMMDRARRLVDDPRLVTAVDDARAMPR